MTVHDNLTLGAARRRDRRASPPTSRTCSRCFPCSGRSSARGAATLSGGEQQMLARRRRLDGPPARPSPDEPSPGSRRWSSAMSWTRSALSTPRATILLVEQKVGVAAALAERAHVLVNGEIAISDRRRLLTNPDVPPRTRALTPPRHRAPERALRRIACSRSVFSASGHAARRSAKSEAVSGPPGRSPGH